MAILDSIRGYVDLVQSLDPVAAGLCSAAFLVYIVAPFAAGFVLLVAAPALDELGKHFPEGLPDDAGGVDIAFAKGGAERSSLEPAFKHDAAG